MGDCKAYARLNVVLGDGEDDALGSFVLRTTSFNTIRTIAARLQYFSAVSGGRLACLPLELKLRGKSPLNRPGFRRHLPAIILGNDGGVHEQQEIHGSVQG